MGSNPLDRSVTTNERLSSSCSSPDHAAFLRKRNQKGISCYRIEPSLVASLHGRRVRKSVHRTAGPGGATLRSEKAGCKRIYQETMGGGSLDRPELEKCLDRLEQGDTLVGMATGPPEPLDPQSPLNLGPAREEKHQLHLPEKEGRHEHRSRQARLSVLRSGDTI